VEEREENESCEEEETGKWKKKAEECLREGRRERRGRVRRGREKEVGEAKRCGGKGTKEGIWRGKKKGRDCHFFSSEVCRMLTIITS